MRKEVHPGVTIALIAIAVLIAGWFYYRVAGNLGGLPYGAKGNPGPFTPEGIAVGKGTSGMGGQARR